MRIVPIYGHTIFANNSFILSSILKIITYLNSRDAFKGCVLQYFIAVYVCEAITQVSEANYWLTVPTRSPEELVREMEVVHQS